MINISNLRPNSTADGNLEGLKPNHEQLISAVLLSKRNSWDSDVVDDDVPPPLPTTSPPKLSPDSTLTWNKNERTPLNLGKYKISDYNFFNFFQNVFQEQNYLKYGVKSH